VSTGKCRVQKKLMMMTVMEAYKLFKMCKNDRQLLPSDLVNTIPLRWTMVTLPLLVKFADSTLKKLLTEKSVQNIIN